MADKIEKKYLDKAGLEYTVGKVKKVISDGDTATLEAAKTYAKDYADGLADNYDAAGTAQTKVDELANGQVKTNKEAIEKLNGADTVEGSVAKSVKDASDAIKETIGTVETGKTLVDMIKEAQTAATYDDTKVKSDIAKNAENIAKNTEAITVLNGTGVGSVSKAVADAKTELQEQITANKEVIDKLDGADTVEGSVKKQIKDAVDTASAALQEQVTANKEVLDKLDGAATVDGSVKKQIADVKAELEQKITDSEYDDTDVKSQIAANKTAIDKLNGEGDGSVKKAIDDAFNDFSTKVSDDDVVNTYKELIDYAAEHKGEAATMAGDIAKNKTAISDLDKKVGTLPEGATATDVVGYAKELVDAEKDRATGIESGLDTRLKAAEAKLGDGDGSVASLIATAKQEAIDAAATDATTKANTAETNAKSHAEAKVKELADGQVATNKTDIAALDGRVEALESVSYVAITTEEIDKLFGDTTITA